MFISSQPDKPIYLVKPTGDYVCDNTGTPLTFSGEALENHPSGHLVDTQGNFLFTGEEYIKVPTPDTHVTTASIPTPTAQASAPTTVAPVYMPARYEPSPTQQATYQEHSSDTEEKTSNRWALILLVIILTLALGVGGGFLLYHFFGNNSADTPQTQETPHENASETPVVQITLPAEAYSGAGSADVPVGAVNVGQYDIILSPTRNLGCTVQNDDSMMCLAMNWSSDRPYGTTPNCTNTNPDYCIYNGLELTPTGQAHVTVGEINGDGYTVPYGSVAYNGNWVCASEENGMTCWSRQSGHGFFINRDGYKGF